MFCHGGGCFCRFSASRLSSLSASASSLFAQSSSLSPPKLINHDRLEIHSYRFGYPSLWVAVLRKSIDGVDKTVTLNCPRPDLKFSLEYIEPVRITIELLKELGFEEVECTDYAVKRSFHYDGVRMNAYSHGPAIWTAIVIADCYENAFPDVCYLHELQNIYWDVHSKELIAQEYTEVSSAPLNGAASDRPYQWQYHQDYNDSFLCALMMAKHEPDVTPGYRSATQSLSSLKIKNI